METTYIKTICMLLKKRTETYSLTLCYNFISLNSSRKHVGSTSNTARHWTCWVNMQQQRLEDLMFDRSCTSCKQLCEQWCEQCILLPNNLFKMSQNQGNTQHSHWDVMFTLQWEQRKNNVLFSAESPRVFRVILISHICNSWMHSAAEYDS